MKACNRWWVALAALVLLAPGSAFAAVDANEMHLALTSLRLALVKIGVADAMLANPKPPATNAEAHVAAPNRMGSNEIASILVSAGGVINVYLTPAVGVTDGILQLVPKIVTGTDGKRTVEYTCYSPNIPDVATAAPECTYRPVGK